MLSQLSNDIVNALATKYGFDPQEGVDYVKDIKRKRTNRLRTIKKQQNADDKELTEMLYSMDIDRHDMSDGSSYITYIHNGRKYYRKLQAYDLFDYDTKQYIGALSQTQEPNTIPVRFLDDDTVIQPEMVYMFDDYYLKDANSTAVYHPDTQEYIGEFIFSDEPSITTIEIDGVTYEKDADGPTLYDINTKEIVGGWNGHRIVPVNHCDIVY